MFDVSGTSDGRQADQVGAHPMNKGRTTPTSWYTEEGGFFGPGYLREYADLITPERTITEVDFLENILPLDRGVRMLDLACGHGRHTIELARLGYTMTGQDLNALFLEEAARTAECAGCTATCVTYHLRQSLISSSISLQRSGISKATKKINESCMKWLRCYAQWEGSFSISSIESESYESIETTIGVGLRMVLSRSPKEHSML
jgi:Methyltransferase domain